jgi:hypothetical protein
MYDRWDRTVEDGNDTEGNLVIVALCVGVALLVARGVVARIHDLSPASQFCPSVSAPARMSPPSSSGPIPNSRPPTPLRV